MANKISLLYLLVLLSLARNTPAEANTSACQLTFDPSIDLRQRYVITWAFSELRCVAGQCDPGSIAVNLGTSNIAIIDIENKKSTIGVPFKETKETPILRDLARIISERKLQSEYGPLYEEVEKLAQQNADIRILSDALRLLYTDILVSSITEKAKIESEAPSSRTMTSIARFRNFNNNFGFKEMGNVLGRIPNNLKQQIILAPYRRHLWRSYTTKYLQDPQTFIETVFTASSETLESIIEDQYNQSKLLRLRNINKVLVENFNRYVPSNSTDQ